MPVILNILDELREHSTGMKRKRERKRKKRRIKRRYHMPGKSSGLSI